MIEQKQLLRSVAEGERCGLVFRLPSGGEPEQLQQLESSGPLDSEIGGTAGIGLSQRELALHDANRQRAWFASDREDKLCGPHLRWQHFRRMHSECGRNSRRHETECAGT